MSHDSIGELPLTVNGEPRLVPTQCTVHRLLDLLDLDGRRIAVAVNRDIVPKSEFPTRLLEGGDRIEILEAVGGG